MRGTARRFGVLLLATTLGALGAGTPVRAIPPLAAGALASPNVDFVANIPTAAAVGGKILGDTLYMTSNEGLRIFDISLGVPVPLGAFDLPHFENESMDTNGRILLVSQDIGGIGFPNMLYVFDVSNPRVPLLKSTLALPAYAHTATCIADCQFAWLSYPIIDVVDLRNPSSPKRLGAIGAGSHNVNVDAAGIAWAGGSAAFDTNGYAGSLAPPVVATASGGGFGWHNSIRPNALAATPTSLANSTIDTGELVVGTDEDWAAALNGLCAYDGPFKTSWYRTVSGAGRIELLDTFTIGRGTLPNAKPAGVVACSSHWVDYHQGVVVDSWYEQGTRFLDVSDPRNIRQIGYYMPVVSEAWHPLFKEVTAGPLPGLYVYVFDYARGIDVLRFTGKAGDPPALAPLVRPMRAAAAPSPAFGWACRRAA